MMLPQTPSFDLTGKRALVTGASSGIGLACATALAQAGAHTVLAARRAEKLQDAVDALAQSGHAAEALPLDVTDFAATRAHIEDSEPYDILVNSAGLARHSAALDTTEADYDAVTDLNVKAAYFLTQAVGKRLIDAGKKGSLINISSQMGHVGGIGPRRLLRNQTCGGGVYQIHGD